MALTDPCKEKQPRVIDNELIYKCINTQFPKGELGRLTNIERIPLDEIEEIRLEFEKILRIDHLWVMTSLTKLQLNNNMIEKIENLETLVHLRELDLSFNKISKIENIDMLTELMKISFFNNLIETLENMDNLLKLTVFSVGRNCIKDCKNVNYLRKFPKLTSLNMAQNPCAEDSTFRNYIAVFLPNLVYYEYVRIAAAEKDAGRKLYVTELRDLQRIEDEENAAKESLEQEKRNVEMHSIAFVENLNTRKLFDQMFETDVEGKALLNLGDEVKELYDEYEEQFIALCKQVFDAGQRHYQIRKAEVDEFLATVDEGKKKNHRQSITVMEYFVDRKNSIFDEIRRFQDEFEIDKITTEKYYEEVERLSNDCNTLMHDAWKDLMGLELQLYEQVEEVNQNFGHVLSDLINVLIEEAQALISQIRALEVNYFENVGDVANRFLSTLNMGEETTPLPKNLAVIMSDREALVNALAASHDVHMQVIDNREDMLINRAKAYVEHFMENLVEEEIKRNRYKLLEITHFLDIQQEELVDLTHDEAVILDIDDLAV